MRKLPRQYYTGDDVVAIARDLLGKVLVTELDGIFSAGIICETEAYAGAGDRASHTYAGKRTPRNEMMYADGGTAYVYLCYGIHHLFNVVTNSADIPHAVLIRSIHPVDGIEEMRRRRGNSTQLTTGGPGTLTQALGIRTAHNGTDLLGDTIYVQDRSITVPSTTVFTSPRIGVNYAGTDALLPYRFYFHPRDLY